MGEKVSITFHKGGSKKNDTVVIESAKQKLVFKAWQHGIIPHEMVHYAVESVFGELKGFLSLIGEGRKQDEIEGRKAGVAAGYIECLVGAFQYELWGLSTATNEQFVSNFSDFTRKAEVDFPPGEFFDFTPDDQRIERCRTFLGELTDAWSLLPEGDRLEYSLPLSRSPQQI